MAADDRERALLEAVHRAPNEPALRALLGDHYLEAGRGAEAVDVFKAARALAPDRDDLNLGLARALEAIADGEGALAVLEAHVRVGNPTATTLMAHARLLLAAGRAEPAADSYRRATALDPGLADAFMARRLGVTEAAATVVGGRAREPLEGESTPLAFDEERPSITFRDVGGMESVKEEIRLKIIHPLQNPELFRAYGKAAGGGILLYGPPGCGKTHLARATAGEARVTFMSVGIHDVLEMWIGQSERNLHALFEQARRSRPAILFFDEVDALGASRGDLRTGAGRQVINQFLSELDGVSTSNDGLLVLAATNAPWHLDTAFRRPGRFDRVLFVPPPDVEARARILEILLTGKPTAGVDVGTVAKKTDGFSGADLKAVVDVAVEGKLAEAMRSKAPIPIGTRDLVQACGRLQPTTREWFATARNYVLYSNQGGLYDAVRTHLGLG